MRAIRYLLYRRRRQHGKGVWPSRGNWVSQWFPLGGWCSLLLFRVSYHADRVSSTGWGQESDRFQPPYSTLYSNSKPLIPFRIHCTKLTQILLHSFRYWQLNPGQDNINTEQSPPDPLMPRSHGSTSSSSKQSSGGSELRTPNMTPPTGSGEKTRGGVNKEDLGGEKTRLHDSTV